MHSWKKKLVVSQLALACTLAITSQANATTYNTWTYYDNPTTALDWSNMDLPGTVDGNYPGVLAAGLRSGQYGIQRDRSQRKDVYHQLHREPGPEWFLSAFSLSYPCR